MCQSCNELVINGVRCHETGCPDEWKSGEYFCKECGTRFYPEDKWQTACSNNCYCAYNGLPYDEE